jgi:hypothetical protein
LVPELKKRILETAEEQSKPILFVVIDNLRYDQWKVESVVNVIQTRKELSYYSILPTATQYARNAIFGLLPVEMEKAVSAILEKTILRKVVNLYEAEFLTAQLKRLG